MRRKIPMQPSAKRGIHSEVRTSIHRFELPRHEHRYSQETSDLVQGGLRVGIHIFGLDDKNLLGREKAVPPLQLNSVEASCQVGVVNIGLRLIIPVPPTKSAAKCARSPEAAPLPIKCLSECQRFNATSRFVMEVRKRPIHRITEQDDEPHLGELVLDTLRHAWIEEIIRARFPGQKM